MAYQPQAATMQYHHQVQHRAHMPAMNNIPIAPKNPTNGSSVHHQNIMNSTGQMNMIGRGYLYQNGQHASSSFRTSVTANLGSKTLELACISPDMTPRSTELFPGDYKKNVQAYSTFTAMPPKDRYLLQLVEAFTFQIRGNKALPGELAVMENARLYYSRLKSIKSKLCNDMEQVVGFRCCGCRQIANTNGQGYVKGAAQLIIVTSNFNSFEVARALEQIREHMLQCQHITASIKQALRPATPKNQTNFAFQPYLKVWMQALQRFSQNKGYPRMNQHQSNGHHTQFSSRGLIAQGGIQNNTTNVQSPTAGMAETEDIVCGELEDSVKQGLITNNYGVARDETRTISPDLSDYPVSKPHDVSPLLELLLQSLCAVQRWGSSPSTTTTTTTAEAAAGTKRSHQEMLSEQQPATTTKLTSAGRNLSNVFFECNLCNQHRFCVSAATGRETADYILSSFYKHLCEECEYCTEEFEIKLIKISEGMSDVQRSLQATVIEKNLKSWKEQFPENTGGNKKKSTRGSLVRQPTSWRPLTWKFLEENTAACIADSSLANKGPSAYLLVGEQKKPNFETRPDDVLFGWNGKHVGNRRFLDLLSETRPAFTDTGRTLEQKKILAYEVMRVIGKRGGRFYYMNANPMLPPAMMTPEQALHMIFTTMKRGNGVLLQPRPNPATTRGRGGCVLECDLAPQRSLFGKEIIRNKRFKKCDPKEDTARAIGQR